MKRAAWYLTAGAVAGFAGVLGLSRATPAVPIALKGTGHAPAGRSGTGTVPGGSGPAAGSTAGGGSGPGQSAIGPVTAYGYGELDVRVTVSRGRITDVTVPVLQAPEPYSQQLAEQVIPMLKSEVLAAGSAQINGVSGATYTSQAYATSLQAALDKLHRK
ncbi:MAG TPA: FMN-binding protein [Streptosporangiaceae bacterium]